MSRDPLRPRPETIRSGRLEDLERSCRIRRLPNGIHAVHVPDPASDAFTVGMVVRCGSRIEPAERSGISHFLEHVLFRGSERYPDYTALASAFEWQGGDWNAATGQEQTEFAYDGVLATSPAAVDLFAEFLSHPRLADVDVERAVILREIDGETNEFGHSTDLDQHAADLLWPGSGIGRPILGTADTLAGIDRVALAAWRDLHYVPSNLAVFAAGGPADDRSIDRLAEAFADHRAAFADRPPTAIPPVAAARGPRVRVVEHGDNEYEIRLAFPCEGEASPDVPVHDVLVRILSDGFSSRLPRRLREDLGLVYDVSADVSHLTDCGVLDVHAAVRLEQFDTFFGELFRILAALADKGPDEEETARSVLRAVVDAERSPEAPDEVAAHVAWDTLNGRTTSLVRDRDRLAAVTPDDVRRVARATFRADRAALVVLGPRARGLEARLRRALADGLPSGPDEGA